MKKKKKKYINGGIISEENLVLDSINNSGLGGVGGKIGGILGNTVIAADAADGNLSGVGEVGGSALKGAGIGATFGGPIGAGVGAVVGGVAGLIGRKRRIKREKREEEARKRDLSNNRQLEFESNSNSSLFPSQGISGITSFRDGGKLNNMNILRGGGLMKITPEISKFKGKTHAQGGIDLDLDNDGITEVEVENNEIKRGNQVFSNKLIPSTEDVLAIENITGIKNIKGTNSEIVEKLSKIKESNSKSNNRFSNKTKRLSDEKIDKAIDFLFNQQQIINGNSSPEQSVISAQNGIDLSNDNFLDRSNRDRQTRLINSNIKRNRQRNINNFSASNSNNTVSQNTSNSLNLDNNSLSNAAFQVGNVANFIANRNSIKELETNVTPSLISSPRFNFVDRRNQQLNENSLATRNAILNLRNSSSQNKSSNIGNLLSKRLQADNRVNQSENLRRDRSIQSFNQRQDVTDIRNNSIINKAREENINRRNQRIALLQQNRQALIQGIVGNIASNRQNQANQQGLNAIGSTSLDPSFLTSLLGA